MRYYIREPGSKALFLSSKVGTPGIFEDSVMLVNKFGLRGRVPLKSDKIRVLVFGGSTVEDCMLNDQNTWCGQLEKLLGYQIWIGNAGRSATNARHHLLQIELAMPRMPKPDFTLVLCGLNDMLFDFGMHRNQDVPVDWDVDLALYRESLFKAIKRKLNLFRRSEVIDLGNIIGALKARRKLVNNEDWITTLPDMAQSLEQYRKTIRTLAKKLSPNIAFITQPALWKENMNNAELDLLYAGGVGHTNSWINPHTKWYANGVLAMMLEKYNNVLRSECADLSLTCIDLARKLPKSIDNFFDDFHFSQHGASQVARIVADDFRNVIRLKGQYNAQSGIYPVW